MKFSAPSTRQQPAPNLRPACGSSRCLAHVTSALRRAARPRYFLESTLKYQPWTNRGSRSRGRRHSIYLSCWHYRIRDDNARRRRGHYRDAAGMLISACGLVILKCGSREVLLNVGIDVYRGEIVALIGLNGTGRAVLCLLLLGIEQLIHRHIAKPISTCIGYTTSRSASVSTP